MNVLARFSGRHGEITIVEDRATGARLYHEAGVYQSYVLPGGSPGLDYVKLMGRVLHNAADVPLFGCGGGALATSLCDGPSRVTVVDNNAISFEIARRYFWMPPAVHCVVDEMAQFLERCAIAYPAIGVDVGGPCFDYEEVLNHRTCALLRRHLRTSGRLTINIACDHDGDETPERIGKRLSDDEFSVLICATDTDVGRNAVIVASDDKGLADKLKGDASAFGMTVREVRE